MKSKHPRFMFETRSVKGYYIGNNSETYKSAMYYYVRVVLNGKTFYMCKDSTLTDQAHAPAFKEREAYQLIKKMHNKYSNISIFSTTKKLSSI